MTARNAFRACESSVINNGTGRSDRRCTERGVWTITGRLSGVKTVLCATHLARAYKPSRHKLERYSE